MQHRISGLIAAALCALVLFTSCRHAEQVEPADVGDVMSNAAEDVLPLQEEPAAAIKEAPAGPVELPESIDPLGFYRAQQEECLTADLAAEKYDAKYERVPGLYEIKNVYMNGKDVRLWLQTNEDETRIRQITLVQVYSHYMYEALYHEIVAVLGEPDGLYLFDFQANKRVRTEEFILPEEKPLYSVWNLEGYTLELGAIFPATWNRGSTWLRFRESMTTKWPASSTSRKVPAAHMKRTSILRRIAFLWIRSCSGAMLQKSLKNTEQRTHILVKGPADTRATIVTSIVTSWMGLIITAKAHALYLENPNRAPESSTMRAMRST